MELKMKAFSFVASGKAEETLKKKIEQDKLDKESEERISRKNW